MALAMAAALCGCAGARQDAVDTALRELEQQVAADIVVTADPADAQAFYVGEKPIRYAVCGVAELHRPSTIPEMNLDRSRQRFISLVNYGGGAVATFEGDPPRAEFQSDWLKRCR